MATQRARAGERGVLVRIIPFSPGLEGGQNHCLGDEQPALVMNTQQFLRSETTTM